MYDRFTNPSAAVLAFIAEGFEYSEITVQFDDMSAIKPAKLKKINKLCQTYQDRINVRFYGMYGQEEQFDAQVLEHLPDVTNLTINCLNAVLNPEFLYQLPHLRHLDFSPYLWTDVEFLQHFAHPEQFMSLEFRDIRNQKLNMQALTRFPNLTSLVLWGQGKGIESIKSLKQLKKLQLRKFPHLDLSILNNLHQLEELFLYSGAQDNLEAIQALPIHTLEIDGIRGLRSLGELQRFGLLKNLIIENQGQLAEIDFTNCQNLQIVSLRKLKGLQRLKNIQYLTHLKELYLQAVSLEFFTEVAPFLPSSLQCCSVYSLVTKENKAINQFLKEKGLK